MAVFDTVDLGLSLSHRVAFRPVLSGLAGSGQATDALTAHLAARAAGGAGLVIGQGDMVVHLSASSPMYVDTHEDAVVDSLAVLTDAVHEADSYIVGQLTHPGAEEIGDWGMQAQSAPSTVASGATYKLPKTADRDDLHELQQGFDDAATNLERALADIDADSTVTLRNP